MNKFIFSILIGLTFLFNACSNSKVTGKKDTQMTNYEVIFQSEYGGTGVDEIKIIQNQGEFAELWVQTTMQPAQSAPHIDFSKKIIVAKNFQSHNSGGTEYAIQSVSQNDNQTNIHYTTKSPEGMATMAITNPLLILSIDKTSDNPQVEFISHNKN